MRTLALVLGAAFLVSCATTRRSPVCNVEVNRCLDSCPRQNAALERQREIAPNTVPQALCQQNCYGVGTRCEEREAKAQREERGKKSKVVPQAEAR